MAFIPRIFLPADAIRDGITFVGGADANHLKNVLRMSVGDKVTVCDGTNTVYPAVITSFDDEGVTLSLGEGSTSKGEFAFPVAVYQCLPKGEKTDLVIQKSVELGATEIVLVMSERCVARPDEKSMEKKLSRFRKIAESAAAQCGRGIVPEVRGLLSYEDAVREIALAEVPLLCYEGSGVKPLRELLPATPRSVAFLIGPEGGISEKEVAFAKAQGLRLCGLGSRILRTETAALFVLAAINVLTDNSEKDGV